MPIQRRGLLVAFCLAPLFASAASGATAPSPAPGTQPSASPAVLLARPEWSLFELGGTKLALPPDVKAPSLEFDVATKRVSGSTGCNRLSGTFAVSRENVKFGPLAITRMACATPLDTIETRFLAELERTKTYLIDLDASELDLFDGDRVLARFRAVR